MVSVINFLSITYFVVLLLLSNFISETTSTNNVVKKQEIFPGTCDSACQRGIDESLDYTASLNQEQTKNHDRLLQRVVKLETEFSDTIARLGTLFQQVSKLDSRLSGNVTALNKKITEDIRVSFENTLYDIDLVKGDFNTKLNNLSQVVNSINSHNHHDHDENVAAITHLYHNVSRRMDSMEFSKIANLTADNHIWRRNFRVVNATFEKIKLTNSCLCK